MLFTTPGGLASNPVACSRRNPANVAGYQVPSICAVTNLYAEHSSAAIVRAAEEPFELPLAQLHLQQVKRPRGLREDAARLRAGFLLFTSRS